MTPKYKAIPVEDYYLVISDELPKIKGDICLWVEDKVIVVDTIKGYYIKVSPSSQFIPISQFRKVIAQSKQVHEGVPLVVLPWEEKYMFLGKETNNLSYQLGYNKAKEKYMFTEEDMKKNLYWTARMALGKKDSGKSEFEIAQEIDLRLQTLKKPKIYEVELLTEDVIYPFNQIEPEVKPLVKKIPLIENGKVTIVNWKEI